VVTDAARAVEALFAPPPEVAAHPAVAAAARIAADVLAPHAAAADDARQGVDPAHLALLAEHGLLSVRIPVAEGGHGAGERVDAEVVELVSGACGATWFMATQHRFPQALSRGPLTALAPEAISLGPAAQRHRAGLASARTSAGIAIAHIRRPGPPTVRAEPRPGGWTFSEDVRAVIDAPAWRAHDAARTANATPASIGLLRRMLVALAELGAMRDRPEAVAAAHTLAERAAGVRAEAYALLTEVPLFGRVAERSALRAAVTELAVRTAGALVAARSGSALLLTSPEQRWAREAAFHLIQAQTAGVRNAQLAAFADPSGERSRLSP
jgi:hypothetical protein